MPKNVLAQGYAYSRRNLLKEIRSGFPTTAAYCSLLFDPSRLDRSTCQGQLATVRQACEDYSFLIRHQNHTGQGAAQNYFVRAAKLEVGETSGSLARVGFVQMA